MKIRVRDFAVALLCVCACFTGSALAIETSASSAASGPAPSIDAPLDSLKRSELYDSFNDIHHGHRHEAIDIMRPRGTPILAVADGVIQKLFLSRQGGLTIYEFDSSETYCYYYAHLDGYADDLHEGMPVLRGDVIGYIGTSGDAEPTAPQLHFAISRIGPDKRWWKGEPIDPYPILLRAVTADESAQESSSGSRSAVGQ